MMKDVTCTIKGFDDAGMVVVRFDSDEHADRFLGALQRRGIRVLGPRDPEWEDPNE